MEPSEETRNLIALTRDGIKRGKVSYEDASKIGSHFNSIKSYLNTGSSSSLEQIEGEKISIDGEEYSLETDLDQIDEWAETGELDIDDIYSYDG